jgi:hypothetical protein
MIAVMITFRKANNNSLEWHASIYLSGGGWGEIILYVARETDQNNYLWTDQDFPVDAVRKL